MYGCDESLTEKKNKIKPFSMDELASSQLVGHSLFNDLVKEMILGREKNSANLS